MAHTVWILSDGRSAAADLWIHREKYIHTSIGSDCKLHLNFIKVPGIYASTTRSDRVFRCTRCHMCDIKRYVYALEPKIHLMQRIQLTAVYTPSSLDTV